jgi:hypothetical protein
MFKTLSIGTVDDATCAVRVEAKIPRGNRIEKDDVGWLERPVGAGTRDFSKQILQHAAKGPGVLLTV